MIEIPGLYNSIPNSDKKMFEAMVETKTFQKGDFLLMDGDVQDHLFMVKSGLLMMHYDYDDKRKVVDFAYKNRFCADINSFTNQRPSRFCIECMNDCTVEMINTENLQKAFDAAAPIERAFRILTEKIIAAILNRNIELSCLSIEERFAQAVRKRPELFGIVQHKHIASYLNIDPTNFSKLLKNFAAKGINFY